MARKCPYCGGKATRRNTSSAALTFGGQRFDDFPCESCGAAVRIPRTIPRIAFALTMLAIVGGLALLAFQGLVPAVMWAVAIGIVASIFEMFVRVEKPASVPHQVSAQSAGLPATEYKRCAVCDQVYSAEYDACPSCARRDVAPTA